jgi:hypothetical protein
MGTLEKRIEGLEHALVPNGREITFYQCRLDSVMAVSVWHFWILCDPERFGLAYGADRVQIEAETSHVAVIDRALGKMVEWSTWRHWQRWFDQNASLDEKRLYRKHDQAAAAALLVRAPADLAAIMAAGVPFNERTIEILDQIHERLYTHMLFPFRSD